MNDEMKEIGNILKDRRKELNLSLKEIENATSIRMSYLQAIEDGDMSKLISAVYAQGFIKQYASFLGMDGESMVRERPDIFSRHEKHEFAYGIGTLEMRGNPSSSVKWFPNALWMLAFILVLLAAWYAAKMLEII